MHCTHRAAVLAVAIAACDANRPPPPTAYSSPAPHSPGGERQAAPVAPKAASVPPPAAAPPPPPAPTLDETTPLVELSVEGFEEAIVSLPLGTTTKRPVLIAAHGNYDRPEWQCRTWREIVGDRGFVLCPRGSLRSDSPSASDPRFTYATNQHLEKEVVAGLAALKARYPDFVDAGPAIWTGFSLGAIMGVAIGARLPASFSRMVLVEGGHDRWNVSSARAFAKGGGTRVLFACGQPGCSGAARLAAGHLERSGVETKVVEEKGVGHNYVGPLAEKVKTEFDWLVEDDPRWNHSGRPQ